MKLNIPPKALFQGFVVGTVFILFITFNSFNEKIDPEGEVGLSIEAEISQLSESAGGSIRFRSCHMSTKHGVLVGCALQGVTYARLAEIMSKEGWKFGKPSYIFESDQSVSAFQGEKVAFVGLDRDALVTSLGILNPR